MRSENFVLFWSHVRTEQNRTWNQCLWNEIRFFFCEMKQNQILILWNEMRLDFFLWDEMRWKMRAALMRWDWIFVKQNISFWFFDQSRSDNCVTDLRLSIWMSVWKNWFSIAQKNRLNDINVHKSCLCKVFIVRIDIFNRIWFWCHLHFCCYNIRIVIIISWK